MNLRQSAVPQQVGLRPLKTSPEALRCRQKFLHFFPQGFHGEKYESWERGYKWKAHLDWDNSLNQSEYRALLWAKNYAEIAARAVRLESRTNLLFSFEKMALRDALKSKDGARLF